MYSSEQFPANAYVRVTGLDDELDTAYRFPEQNTNEEMHSVVEFGDKLFVRSSVSEISSVRLSDGYIYPAHRIQRVFPRGIRMSERERLTEMIRSMRTEMVTEAPRPVDPSVVSFTVPEEIELVRDRWAIVDEPTATITTTLSPDWPFDSPSTAIQTENEW